MKQTKEEIAYYDSSQNGIVANQVADIRAWILVVIVALFVIFDVGKRIKRWIK